MMRAGETSPVYLVARKYLLLKDYPTMNLAVSARHNLLSCAGSVTFSTVTSAEHVEYTRSSSISKGEKC